MPLHGSRSRTRSPASSACRRARHNSRRGPSSSVWRRRFDLQSRRDTIAGRYAYDFNKDLGFNVAISSTKDREPALRHVVRLQQRERTADTIDNRTNDISAGLEYVRSEGMVRVAWDSSFFNNTIKQIVWDNPLRATDTNPIDASGYSNGNGRHSGACRCRPATA